MKLGELIEIIIDTRGQQYDEEFLVGWVNEIEGQAVDEVINQAEGYDIEFTPYEYVQDAERSLQIPDRFRDVYINYLYAKIDFGNQETERYNNDVAMYNASYEAYAAWFRRENRPKKRTMFSKF